MQLEEITNTETNNYKHNGHCDANTVISASAALTTGSTIMLATAGALG